MKLNRTLRNALLDGPKQAGSYDPDDVMHRIEEHLTGDEYDAAEAFLRWVTDNQREYGHGNIDSVYEEWRRG